MTILPRRDFIATTTTPGGLCWRRLIHTPMDDSVLKETPLKDAGWATLFAYMHRRFGPPHVAGDDYKDLSASWILTTPDPNALVQVKPSLSSFVPSFTPYVRMEGLLGDYEQFAAAYRDTLLDLLRPVCVRDSLINAMGKVGPDADLWAEDEDTGERIYEVRYHPSCGTPIPHGLFGGEAWGDLCALIALLGGGDMAAGRSAAIELLQAHAKGLPCPPC